MSQYKIKRGERQYGPFLADQIPDMLTNGQIHPDDYCWTEGMQTWQPVSDIFPSNAKVDDEMTIASQPILPDPSLSKAASDEKFKGIGGWLILVGINVILTPLRIARDVWVTFVHPDYWEWVITNNSLLAKMIIGELVINGILIVTSIFIVYLFFAKKKLFPNFFIGMRIFHLIFLILDAVFVGFVLPSETVFDNDTVKEIFSALVALMIWVPYMLISKRVKATFIN